MRSLAAENASSELPARAVTRTILPSAEETTRTGLQPAATFGTTDSAGSDPAAGTLMTVSVPIWPRAADASLAG